MEKAPETRTGRRDTTNLQIEFPFIVELPPGFDRALSEFVNLVCERYEEQHPDRVMWPAGHGSKPIWREPEEPLFDDTIFHISISEREAYPKKALFKGGEDKE